MTLDPEAISCDAQRRHSALDGTPLYQGGNHLKVSGSRLVGERLLERDDNLLQADSAPAEREAKAIRQAASG